GTSTRLSPQGRLALPPSFMPPLFAKPNQGHLHFKAPGGILFLTCEYFAKIATR
ncbi:hypothetical protein HAX54_048789, partial [Datura stramonium]|nr:hypothetical protein [Datura stramonium]